MALYVWLSVNIISTHERKLNRYSHITIDIEEAGYTVNYYAFEIGSRGYASPENVQRIKCFVKRHAKEHKIKTVKDNISKLALLCSFVIFHSKFEEQWIQPKLAKL